MFIFYIYKIYIYIYIIFCKKRDILTLFTGLLSLITWLGEFFIASSTSGLYAFISYMLSYYIIVK